MLSTNSSTLAVHFPRVLYRIIILIAMGLSFYQAMAQRHHFVAYSVREGLAQSQVRDIIQTSDGYLWIATVGGISRFDGATFTTYNKSNGLMYNLANSLYETKEGTIVVACQGGLVEFRNNSIAQLPLPAIYNDVMIMDMVEFEDNLVLATNGNGLLFYNHGKVKKLDLGSKDLNFIRSLEVNDNGRELLIGTKGGALKYTNKHLRVMQDSISVSKIVSDGGRIWITTYDDGVFLFENEHVTQFTERDGLPSMHQRNVCVDNHHNPWFISKNSVIRYNLTTRVFERINSIDPNQTTNLKVIYCDSESNIWIGTSGRGILKYTGDAFETFTTADDLESDIITCIRQQPDSILWLASYGLGLMRYDMDNASVRSFNFSHGLLNNTMWSLLVLGNEHLWIGTAEGISIYEHGKIRDFDLNDSLPYPVASSLFLDSENQIWIGTRDGLLVVKDSKVRTPPALKKLDIQEIKSFVQLDNTIWMSSSNGVYGYDLTTGKIQHVGKVDGLPENPVSCIAPDARKQLWLGTNDGISVYSTETHTTRNIPISKAASSNIVNFLFNEDDKHLWIGTDNGLFSLDLQSYHKLDSVYIRHYNEHDGVVNQECNQNAVYEDLEGALWFGTNSGLIRFNPTVRKEEDKEITAIHLLDVQVNFESVPDRINLQAVQPSENELTYKENRLTFRFSAVHYSNPSKVLYSYRLVGSDEGWSPPVRDNYVTYANLSPGDYEFQVRAKLENFPWNDKMGTFRFHIAPPFWLEWWFILLGLLLLIGLGYAVYYQVHKEQQRKRSLEEAQNKAKILGLEQQTLNAHMNRHFIFNALNSIQYYINTQDRKLANMYLTNFAALVRKNLDSAQVESIYLKDELDRLKLYMNLEQMRFKDRFDYNISVDEELDTESLLVPSMILQPFVENSIMHGILPSEKKGKIDISIKHMGENMLFQIIDNGIGIDTSVKQKNGTSMHVSNGMKITKQRMQLLGKMTRKNYDVSGPQELKDENDESIGTIVTISLPQHYRNIEDVLQ